MHGSILIVNDDADVAELLRHALHARGMEATTCNSPNAALAHLEFRGCDLIVIDVDMAEMSGIELCGRVQRSGRDLLSIVITRRSDTATAVEAIRAGAFDFVTKPFQIEALAITISRAIEHLYLGREVRRLRDNDARLPVNGIAGTGAAILATLDMIARVANSDTTVMIQGESGTGKELVARALHDQSSRRNQPFIAVNCGAMAAPLLESELFGHVKGAFTDARDSRPGLFVQARAGTIFLDEIGELPLEMQVKLLRVLQERSLRPVGGDSEVEIKARVITATNRDLEREVEERRFREDLLYRINVVAISVPPLRDRQEDILALAQLFLVRIAERMRKPVRGISAIAARRMLHYDWPGNVRELENCMERAVALCRLDEITIEDLPRTLTDQTTEDILVAAMSASELITLKEMSLHYVRKVVEAVKGNKAQAARILDINRRSLYRWLEDREPTSDEEAGKLA